MRDKYNNLLNEILNMDHSYDEWKDLRQMFDEAMREATEEEQNVFAESGAGEIVCMATQ